MSCIKCGYPAIIGPIYVEASTAYYGECLKYRCGRCGYSWNTPTIDKQKSLEQIAIERAQLVGQREIEKLTEQKGEI